MRNPFDIGARRLAMSRTRRIAGQHSFFERCAGPEKPIKRILLSASIAALSTTAHADLYCHMTYDNGHTMEWIFGSASDPTAFAEIGYRKDNSEVVANTPGNFPFWTVNVNNALQTAYLISRKNQGYELAYFLEPNPNVGVAVIWHNNNVVGKGACKWVYPTPASTTVATAPAFPTILTPSYVTPVEKDEVPLDYSDRTIHMFVFLGGRGVRVLLDTGATNVSINQVLANSLIAAGQAAEGEPVRLTMADGSVNVRRSIVIGTVTIGAHSAHNVGASVEPNNDAEPLLGMSVLNAISGGKFSIDTGNNKLILGSR